MARTATTEKEERKTYKMRVRVTLIEDMLGTAPADPEIYKKYIASKAPDGKSIEDEIESLGVEQVYANSLTVFHRDPKTGEPIIYDYLIKGFFKNACGVLRSVPGTLSSKIKNYKKYIDGLVFAQPRRIPIGLPEGAEITICERPLRAQTAQGERIALAASESIPKGSTLEFDLIAFNKEMFAVIPEWMDYGEFNGLGQWHNSGKGRFVWRDITDEKEKEGIDDIIG